MSWDRIWANRLIAGAWTWESVPEKRRHGVTQELAARVAAGELSEAQMNEIIGK